MDRHKICGLTTNGRTWRDAWWAMCGLVLLHPAQTVQSIRWVRRAKRENPDADCRYFEVTRWR